MVINKFNHPDKSVKVKQETIFGHLSLNKWFVIIIITFITMAMWQEDDISSDMLPANTKFKGNETMDVFTGNTSFVTLLGI